MIIGVVGEEFLGDDDDNGGYGDGEDGAPRTGDFGADKEREQDNSGMDF